MVLAFKTLAAAGRGLTISMLSAALLCLPAPVQAERYAVPWFEPPSAGGDPQGVLRIVNAAADAGTVTIHAIDDAGVRTEAAVLALNGSAAVEISATELQAGDAAKGLSSGVGNLSGGVRLAIESDVPIVPLAFVRSADGSVSAVHDTVLPAAVPETLEYRYDVALFHPASNATQPSRLRLINPTDGPAEVTIDARDDVGMAATGGAVELTLPAGGARTLSAQQLEAGDAAAFSGRLGAGVGNWRLGVSADRPIEVVSLAMSAGGDWNNLSTTAMAGWAPVDGVGFEARFLERTIVSRDGQDRNEFQVLESDRLLHRYVEDGVEVRQESRFEYERMGRDAGLVRLDYDAGVNCEARFYFGSRHSGWYAFACVDSGNRVDVWNGGAWLSLDAGVAPLDLGPPLDDSVHAVGTAIDALTLPAAGGGEGELTYSLSPSVPGLSFDPDTRRLSGSPTEAGIWTMTYRVRDASGDTDWRYFNIAVEAPGSGQETTHAVGDTLSDLPTASWTPDVISGGSFSLSGATATVRLDEGGYIEEGESRYTCQSSGGCVIENRRVTSGTVVQSARGTAPGDGTDEGSRPSFPAGSGPGDQTYNVGTAISALTLPAASGGDGPLTYSLSPAVPGLIFDATATVRRLTGTPTSAGSYDMIYRVRDVDGDTDSLAFVVTVQDAADGSPVGSFDLHEDNSWPSGIAHANDRFHVLDVLDDKVYAYSEMGPRDASADFGLDEDNSDAHGIAHANGRFHVVDGFDKKAYAYAETGARDASADFDLHEDNLGPAGIAHANGRFHVVDSSEEKVFAYTDTGVREPSADFDLHEDNSWPRGIAHANGRFYVVDVFEEKVFAYTETGARDASADFDLLDENILPAGIAHANGRFYVVDNLGADSRVYEYGGSDPTARPSFATDSGPGDRTYTVGTAISALTLPAATGGDGPLTYSLSPEVPGLSFNATTRRITGTPTSAGTYNMTYRVRDADGDTDELRFSIAVEAPGGDGGQSVTFDSGDTIDDLPTGSWTPGEISNGSFLLSGGIAVIELDDGGYIEEGDYRFTCETTGGCRIDNRRVTSGTIARTSTGTGPGDGDTDTASDDHGDDRASATAVGAGSDTEGVLTAGDVDYFSVEVSAAGTLEVYTSGDLDTLGRLEDANGTEVDDDDDGGADTNFRIAADVNSDTYYVRVSGFSSLTAGDYTLHVRFSESTATTDPPAGIGTAEYFDLGDFAVATDITYANGQYYVLDIVEGRVYAYTASGARVAAADFDLDEDNDEATGIVHANGRFYVVDTSENKVYVYTDSGNRVVAADFDLDDENYVATGIAYAGGRFHVVDYWTEKVYAYTAAGDRDSSADFALDANNVNPQGIVHADGRFHVVDATGGRVYAYTSAGDRVAAADFNLDAQNGDATGIAHGNGGFRVVDWSDDEVYAYTDSGARDTAANFNLGAENVSARGIVHADGRFHLVNVSDHRVYAYTDSGDRDTSADFNLDDDNVGSEGIAYASDRFYVVDGFYRRVYAYTDSGIRDAAADFDLDDDNFSAGGVAHANGRLFVVDSIADKVFAYSVSGDRDASADFDLDGGNDDARGIAHADGRFYVADWFNEKVYAYTDSGARDASADFDLDGHNIVPEGIAFANGRLYVVDAGVDRVYAYPAPSEGSAATGDDGSSIF